jgi:glutaminyl-tRNA synthetase
MYTFAHPIEDALEGVTHSLCSLEFEDQRPFYDWVIQNCKMPHASHQYEFGKLSIDGAIIGKRYIKMMVEAGILDGWDDPRVYTVSGMRRRGYTPEAIKAFIRETGISKSNGVVDPRMLEHFIREDLKLKAPRTMAILHPLKAVITNYPEGETEWLPAENNQENPEMGERQIPFSREIYVEQDDFMEVPAKKYFRLFPGNEVRLKNAYFIRCNDVIKDADGNVVELHCTYDPETKSGSGFTGRKVKGTIHWVEAGHAVPARFRLIEPLLLEADKSLEAEDVDGLDDVAETQAETAEAASAGGQAGVSGAAIGAASKTSREFLDRINPNSLVEVDGYVEPNMADADGGDKFQFFRHGYFNVDPKLSGTDGRGLVFNRIVELKSSFKM